MCPTIPVRARICVLLVAAAITLLHPCCTAALSSPAAVKPTHKITYGTISKLPAVTEWPHHPVLFQAIGHDAKNCNDKKIQAQPIGVPIEFETPLFRGKMLLRLRNAKSDDPVSHAAYFSKRKRVKQMVVQGQFKENIKMSEVYIGDRYKKPLGLVPPPTVARIIARVLRRVAPGVILDLASKQPKVLTLLAGTTQALSIDLPGEEPEIDHAIDLPENTSRLFGEQKFASSCERKQFLSNPKQASNYQFDTDHVYTFHSYDDFLDLGTYHFHLPILGKFDMAKTLGNQPMSVSAMTAEGQYIFNFCVWHEKLLPGTKKKEVKNSIASRPVYGDLSEQSKVNVYS